MSNGNLRRRAVSLPPIALDAELDFNHPDLNEGLAYWREKAAGRAMPLLPDIHPEEIPRLLPYLSLFEIHRVAGTVEFFPRLAAPKMEDVFGPIHRKPLHTVLAPEISERWEGAARTMIEMSVPLRGGTSIPCKPRLESPSLVYTSKRDDPMSILSKPYFHDEAAAYAKLEAIIWPEGPVCPHCGCMGRIYNIKANPEKRVRLGLHKCGDCRKQFTVKVGTVFEASNVKLNLWFQAAYLMASSKKGISAHQLHRTLGVTYKTAWFMAHRLREAMRVMHIEPMGGEGKFVEADETYIGGKETNKHRSKRNSKNIGGMGKEIVFSLVEREGRVRSQHVPSVTAKTLRPILVAQLDAKTFLMTDDAGQYRHMSRDFAHETVNHGAGEYVRGDAHTNTIEGYFSVLKRGVVGTYHHVSQQHLKRYLAEFDFRYNERMSLGVNDEQRAAKALSGIKGKRLYYRQPV